MARMWMRVVDVGGRRIRNTGTQCHVRTPYQHADAVILCRGNTLADEIVGGVEETGKGATQRCAQAAIHRDRQGDIASALSASWAEY